MRKRPNGYFPTKHAEPPARPLCLRRFKRRTEEREDGAEWSEREYFAMDAAFCAAMTAAGHG